MHPLQTVALGLISINALIFILGTKAVFRSDRAKSLSYLFMIAFGIILATSLGSVYTNCTDEKFRLFLALLLSSIAIFVFFWASQTIRKQPFTIIFSPDTPEFLVQEGPYQWIRHPFYTSYLMNFFSASIITNNIAAAISTSVTITTIYIIAAKQEESKFAKSHLSEAYQSYKQRTGMFLPKILQEG